MTGLHWWKILGVTFAVVATPVTRWLAWWRGTPRHAADESARDAETVAFYGSMNLADERELAHEWPAWPPRRTEQGCPRCQNLDGTITESCYCREPLTINEEWTEAADAATEAADWLACRSLAYVQATTEQACR